jgi:ribulose 1,5-bisphosphate synthetase/thiazole synthase
MRRQTHTFTQKVSTLTSADVVVVGGGPSGIAAALSARRCGKSVLLIEQSGQLGGMGTLGGVAIWMPVGNVTGIYAEIVREMNINDNKETTEGRFAPLFNPFTLRHYFNRKMEKEGVDVFFHCSFAGLIREGSDIRAAVVHCREGLCAIEAKTFVDATGNASLASESGVAVKSGREEDGMTQPMTLMFQMQDTGRPQQAVLPKGCPEYKTIEELPQGRTLHWENEQTGTLLINMTRVRGHGAKVKDVSIAEREALKQVFGVAHYLQKNGYENYIISHIAGQTGVRETYQIEGVYTLTEADLASGCRFDDVVARTNYGIDIHNPSGKGGTDLREVSFYDIPYRTMVMHEVDNLIVAGRAISADHVAMSSLRVQPTAYALGQAAGIACSLSLEDNVTLREISIPKLHDTLKAQGVEFN